MKDTFISTTRESFTEAIQRGNNCLKSLFEAGYKEKIIKEYSYFFANGDKEKGQALGRGDGIDSVSPVAILSSRKPYSIEDIAKLENKLGIKLPPSYYEFLSTIGRVTFLDYWTTSTWKIEEIDKHSKDIKSFFTEGHWGEDDSFKPDYPMYFEKSQRKIFGDKNPEVAWLSWEDKEKGLFITPSQVTHLQAISISDHENSAGEYFIASNLKNNDESPIFLLDYDNEGYVHLIGYNCQEWFTEIVNGIIRSVSKVI